MAIDASDLGVAAVEKKTKELKYILIIFPESSISIIEKDALKETSPPINQGIVAGGVGRRGGGAEEGVGDGMERSVELGQNFPFWWRARAESPAH